VAVLGDQGEDQVRPERGAAEAAVAKAMPVTSVDANSMIIE
jgi:hypothetical protein